MIDYRKFQMSLKRLEEQYEQYRHLDPALAVHLREAMDESIIQRFEVCFDSAWKALKRHLAEALGVPSVPNSPKPVFRLAYENDLLAAPLEDWLDYADHRVDTSHDYSFEKAQACLEIVPDFIDDAIGLYQTVTGDPWE